MNSISLTVLYDEPFWIGVLERHTGSSLRVAKITFGVEPKDTEVMEILLERWMTIVFSEDVTDNVKPASRSPKRRQRNAAREVAARGIRTKSQQALAAERETQAAQRKKTRCARKDEKTERQFQLRQQKRKEKHRGH